MPVFHCVPEGIDETPVFHSVPEGICIGFDPTRWRGKPDDREHTDNVFEGNVAEIID